MLFYAYEKTDGDEHACARDLLFSLIEKHLPEIAGGVLCHADNGAPYLSIYGERAENCFVSLSHSHGLCAAAISDSPVGVDVELVRKMKSEQSIDDRFMNRLKMPDSINDSPHPFFYRWTYLEACYKVTQKYDIPLPAVVHETIEANGGEYVLCIVKK